MQVCKLPELSDVFVSYHNSASDSLIKKTAATLQDSAAYAFQSQGMFESVPSWAIIFFLVLIFMFLFYTVFKTGQLKINILENRKSKLESLVNERTSDLLKEKDKFEQLLLDSERAKEDLKRANDIKTKLINVAAHDLKNPLQSILGFQDLLNERLTNDPDAVEMLETIFSSSNKMLNIVNETLSAAAAELNEIVIKKNVYNVYKVVKDVVNPNLVRANQKLQVIHTNLDKSIYAEFDKELICRALDNLLSNAIKYSEYNKNIWVDAFKDGNYIKIAVKDEGPGISSEDIEKVFGEFQTIGSIPTGGETSSGYGLFLAKDIIVKHGGDIKVESQVGLGSKFIVELPL